MFTFVDPSVARCHRDGQKSPLLLAPTFLRPPVSLFVLANNMINEHPLVLRMANMLRVILLLRIHHASSSKNLWSFARLGEAYCTHSDSSRPIVVWPFRVQPKYFDSRLCIASSYSYLDRLHRSRPVLPMPPPRQASGSLSRTGTGSIASTSYSPAGRQPGMSNGTHLSAAEMRRHHFSSQSEDQQASVISNRFVAVSAAFEQRLPRSGPLQRSSYQRPQRLYSMGWDPATSGGIMHGMIDGVSAFASANGFQLRS